MLSLWLGRQDRAAMRFGTIVATVYNLVRKKGANPLAWTDIFKPLKPGQRYVQRQPTTYEEYLEAIRRDPKGVQAQGRALKAQFQSAVNSL